MAYSTPLADLGPSAKLCLSVGRPRSAHDRSYLMRYLVGSENSSGHGAF